MPLQPETQFSLQSLEGGTQPRSKVFFAGRPGPEIDGKDLEGQFKTDTGQYFLVLTDGSPFEETIRCYFLSDELAVIDQLVVAELYCSFTVDKIESAGERELTIHSSFEIPLLVELNEEGRSAGSRFVKRLNGIYISPRGYISLIQQKTN